MNDRNALDDLDASEARIDIRCGAIRGDPLKYVLNGPSVFDSLTVPGNGCGRMKRRAHEVAVAGASGSYVKVHGAGDRIMLGEIRVGNRFNCGERLALIR